MALTRITKGVIKPNENYDTHNINSTGIVTAIGLDVNGNGDISGNLNVGGVLTYEDVTSIDSVGIITAQKDIHVGAGISVVGVGSFGSLDIAGDIDVDGHTNLDNVNIAGVTSTTGVFVINAGTQSTNKTTGALRVAGGAGIQGNVNVGGDLDVDGHTNLDNVSIAGVTTMSGNLRIESNYPRLYLTDTNHNSDFSIVNNDGNFLIYDDTNTLDRFSILANGTVRSHGNFDALGGIDVTGNANISGDLDVDGHTELDNVNIAGVTTHVGNVLIPNDTGKLLIGASQDLQFYHDFSGGSENSHIRQTTNKHLQITAYTTFNRVSGTWGVIKDSNSHNIIRGTAGSDVKLYFNNGEKLATTNTGVAIIGVCSATSYTGDGSNLTGITQTTINSNTNNYLITGTGTANTLQGESALTFDGSTLAATGAITATGTIETTGSELKITGAEPRLTFTDTDNNPDFQIWANAQKFAIYDSTNSATRLHINSSGKIGINTTSPGRMTHIFSGSTGHPLILERGDTSNTQIELRTGGATRGYWGCSTTANFMVYDNDASDINFTVHNNGDISCGGAADNNIYNDSSGGGLNFKNGGQLVIAKQASSTADPLVWLNDTGQTTNKFLLFAQDGTEKASIGLAGNDLRFARDGYNETMRITSTGYVQTKSELWVGGSAPVLRWRDSTHGEKATARIDGSDLYFEVANNERLRIHSTGQLDNLSTAAINTKFKTSNSSGSYNIYELGNSGASLGFIGSGTQLATDGGATDFCIRAQSGGLKFCTGGADERLIITSSGNIETKGLGTFEFNDGWSSEGRNVVVFPYDDSSNWFSFVGTGLRFTDGGNFVKPSDQANSNWGNIAGVVFEGSNNGTDPAIRFVVDQPGGNGMNYSLGSGSSGKTAAIDNKSAMTISSDHNIQLRQLPSEGSSQQKLQWISNSGSLSAQAAWGQGSANFDFNVYRIDSQTDYPYGNFRVLTGHGTSPTEALKVTVGGQVLKPRNPAFRAQSNSHYANQSGSVSLIYNNEIFDKGSNYNPSTGRFTAPVTGRYFFHYCFLTYPDNDPGFKSLLFNVNGNTNSYIFGFARSQENSQRTSEVSAFLELSANDWVMPYVACSGTFDFYMTGGHAHFFGYLVS